MPTAYTDDGTEMHKCARCAKGYRDDEDHECNDWSNDKADDLAIRVFDLEEKVQRLMEHMFPGEK